MAEATVASGLFDTERHFQTDHLEADLRGRSIRGGAVTLGAQAIKFVLQMGSTAILARVLTPADFGLIAMVSVFTGFVGLFKDLGLSTATVQRAEITHEQVSTLFWINVLVSLVLTAVGVGLAPVVAWVNHEPRLIWVTMALSGTFIFGGLTSQHTALLQRQMRFRALAAIDIGSLVVSIAVALAWPSASYWSLVAMTATQAVAALIGTWLACRWWPGLPRRRIGVMPLLKFGGNLTGFNILNYFSRNFDNFIIGALLGAGPLGVYSKAYNLLLLPISQLIGPIGAVAMPALSRLQHNHSRYRSYLLRIVDITAFCAMPLVAFTFVEADGLVSAVLGARWSGVVPVFRCLAPAALVGAFGVIPYLICASRGQSRRQFRWAMFASPVIVTGFVVGIHWGIVGVAASFGVLWSLLIFAFVAYACVGSPVRMYEIASHIWKPALSSVAAALMTAAMIPSLNSVFYSAISVVVGAGLFIATFILSGCLIPGGSGVFLGIINVMREFRSEAT